MYRSKFRDVLSGKLLPSMLIIYCISFVLIFPGMYLIYTALIETVFAAVPTAPPKFAQDMFSSMIPVLLIIVFVIGGGIACPPVIGGFMIHSRARSGLRFKTAPFTILKAYVIVALVGEGLAVPSIFVGLFVSPLLGLSQLVVVGVSVTTTVFLLLAANALQSYAREGRTYKRISPALPILYSISIVLSILLTVYGLFNTFSTMELVGAFSFINPFVHPLFITGFVIILVAYLCSLAAQCMLIAIIMKLRPTLAYPEELISY